MTGLILLTISCKFQIIVKILIVQNPQTKMREILADTRVLRATVPIPALASASVLHSAAVGGSFLM